jgi:hypothetical protein
MGDPATVRIIDISDEPDLQLLPPCADPRFDHRSCDYWEDAIRGSKSARPAWWQTAPSSRVTPSSTRVVRDPFGGPDPLDAQNPFAPAQTEVSAAPNPFAPSPRGAPLYPFGPDDADPLPNPFAPPTPSRPDGPPDGPRKLQLLTRGQLAFGSYAKVLLLDERPAAYAQFGPLSAYPRALRMRELYPQLPSSPLPAVITCIATTVEARGQRLAQALVRAVCDDLGARGFAAVETYPDLTLPPDEASAAHPPFWERCGFATVVNDERFPVMRRELD